MQEECLPPFCLSYEDGLTSTNSAFLSYPPAGQCFNDLGYVDIPAMQLDGASWVCPSFDPGSSITPLDNFGIRTSSATLSNHDFMNLFNEFLEPERCRPLIHPQGQVTYSGNPNEEVPSPELVVSSALTYQPSSDSTVTASVNRSYSLPRAPRPFVCTECSARFVEQRQLR